MPPKKKGGKKARKTKEQLEAERIEREAEEARIREEEEKRLEEERLRREEEERLRKELEAKLRREELDRLTAESEELSPKINEFDVRIASVEAEDKAAVEWRAFLDCSKSPNPNSQAELNTFLTLWREAEEKEMEESLAECQDAENVSEFFGGCLTLLQLARLVRDRRTKAICCNDGEYAAIFDSFLSQVRELEISKIDAATSLILQHYDRHMNARNEVLIGHNTGDIKVGIWMNLATKGFRMKTIMFPGLGFMLEIPKVLALMNVGIRLLWFSTDTDTPPDGIMGKQSVGGVIHIDLLEQPSQVKHIRGWTLRPSESWGVGGLMRVAAVVPPNALNKLKYPLESMPTSSNVQPLRIKWPVEDEFIIAEEEVSVGCWNGVGAYSEGPISDTEVEDVVPRSTAEIVIESSRMLGFSTVSSGIFAHLQMRIGNIPYDSWCMYPLSDSVEVVLKLATARETYLMKISPKGFSMIGPDVPELAGLIGVYDNAAVILSRLKDRGVYLCPGDEDGDELDISPKLPCVEDVFCRELCAIISGFIVSSAAANSKLPPSQALMRLREVGGDEGETVDPRDDIEETWKYILFEQDVDCPLGAKVSIVACSEEQEGEEKETNEIVALPVVPSEEKLSEEEKLAPEAEEAKLGEEAPVAVENPLFERIDSELSHCGLIETMKSCVSLEALEGLPPMTTDWVKLAAELRMAIKTLRLMSFG